jgi:predicted outer membrane protein
VASLFVCSGFDVKKFAQRVVGDASKAKQELMSVADKKRLVPPKKLDKKHEGMLEKL